MVYWLRGLRFYAGFFVYICNMNIDEIYKLVSYMVDKYQGTYLSPDDFNMSINAAQKQYLNFLTGETAEFTQSRTPRRQSGIKDDVTTGGSLSAFIKEATLTITTQIAPQPSDFYKISAMRTTDDDYFIRRIGADKVFAYVNNPIDPATTTSPFYTELGNTFKFWPSNLATAKIVYFKKPADAKWAYTGNLVYDPANSVQLEWPENDHIDIIYRTLGIIGVNLKDADLLRVAQTVKNDGQ